MLKLEKRRSRRETAENGLATKRRRSRKFFKAGDNDWETRESDLREERKREKMVGGGEQKAPLGGQ